MLPLSSVFASANQNEKKHSLTTLDKAKRILQQCKAKVRSVVADSQYSDSGLEVLSRRQLFLILRIKKLLTASIGGLL